MKIPRPLKIALLVIGLIVVLFFAVYFYYGGLWIVHVKTEQTGGETIVYETYAGHHAHVGNEMTRMYYTIKGEEKADLYQKAVIIGSAEEKKKTRTPKNFDIGFVVDGHSQEITGKLIRKYKAKTLPKEAQLTAEFPYRGPLSISIGYAKTKKAFRRTLAEKKIESVGGVVEIIDVPGKKITYRQQIGK